jgi:SAM-dependent methyltransferase
MFSPLWKHFDRQRRKRESARAVRIKLGDFGDIGAFCTDYAARSRSGATTQALDIGCGTTPRNPFNADGVFGIDIRDDVARNIKYADLAVEAIPYADNTFDYVTAFEFLEHVPRILYAPARRFPFVELMNEIHRVLKPGGVLLSHTPAYPYPQAFQDPTHVNIITEATFANYFDDSKTWARIYGFTGAFTVLRQGWNKPHLISVLRKPAP